MEHYQETPYHLHALSPQASIRLLLDNVQRKISSDEMKELLEYEIPDDHPIHEHFPLMNLEQTTLTNHPFTLLLGGHPQAIALAAPMLEHQTLKELFQQLLDSNIMDALDYQENQSYVSLRMSLEISINNIKKTNPEAIDLFKLMGLLPGGIRQPELTELWGDKTWNTLKTNLIRASMLVYKPTENTLTLLPFMSARAYELLEADEGKKTEFHLKCCRFYKDYCLKFIDKINANNFNLNEFVERESNIWACIYRGINRKKDTDDYDDEESVKMPKFGRSLTIDVKSNSKTIDTSKNVSGLYSSILSPLTENVIIEEEPDNSFSDTSSEKGRPLNKNATERKVTLEVSDDSSDSEFEEESSPDLMIKPNESSETQYLAPPGDKRNPTENRVKKDSSKMISLLAPTINEIDDEELGVEELLVMYYISIAIRLCKLSDARKAINEYSKKSKLSLRAQAHLHQYRGVLAMMCQRKDKNEVETHFNNALECYQQLKSIRGVAICKLALLRIECEDLLSKEISNKEIEILMKELEIIRKEFENLDYMIGIERVNSYLDSLNKRYKGESKVKFKTFMRFKTLKKAHIADVTAKDSDLSKALLNDEDIKLFTAVFESNIKHRKKPKIRPIIPKTTREKACSKNKHNLSVTLNSSKSPMTYHRLSTAKSRSSAVPPLACRASITKLCTITLSESAPTSSISSVASRP